MLGLRFALLLGLALPNFSAEEQTGAEVLKRAEEMRAIGKSQEAEPLYRQALALQEEQFGPDRLEVVPSLSGLSEVLHLTGRETESLVITRRILRIQEKTLPPDDPAIAITLNNLAELHRLREQYVSADPLYQRSRKMFENAFGPNHPWVARVLNNLASLRATTGRYEEADELFQKALRISEANGAEGGQIAGILNNLAVCALERRKMKQAEAYLVQAMAIQARVPETEDAVRSEIAAHHAYVLQQTGRGGKATGLAIQNGSPK